MRALIQEYMVSSQYFAPRGKERLMFLGEQIAQRHLSYNDRLIGIVGDAGSGKSSLIKGMFPGLELANDDDVIHSRKIMQVRSLSDDWHDSTTFHIDMRFQTAFTQMFEIVAWVQDLLTHRRRVIVEHFNLLYPALGRNADIILGIGEEIIVSRPSVFGPLPESIYQIVHTSLKFRKMAHTAEDVTMQTLEEDYGITENRYFSSDVRNGFVLKFKEKPEINLDELEQRVKERLARHLEVSYFDEGHIRLGDKVIPCDGSRFHVRNTSEITDFSLARHFIFDAKTNTYCLVGLIDKYTENLDNRNTQYFLTRKCSGDNNEQ